jgi:hypothetical protein
VVEAEDRFAMVSAVRIAVWGKPEDIRALRPGARSASGKIEYDETGLAEELASFGFIEVPADGE